MIFTLILYSHENVGATVRRENRSDLVWVTEFVFVCVGFEVMRNLGRIPTVGNSD